MSSELSSTFATRGASPGEALPRNVVTVCLVLALSRNCDHRASPKITNDSESFVDAYAMGENQNALAPPRIPLGMIR